MHVNMSVAATGSVRSGTNMYVSSVLTRSRTSISALAQKPRILEQSLVQGRIETQEDETESRLTMPLLGKIWKEMAAHLP